MSTIAVIGSGNVGRALAGGLQRAGHQVSMGRRDHGAGVVVDGVEALDVATAIGAAEIIINATPGDTSVQRFAPLAETIGTRVLIDVSNGARAGTAAELQHRLPRARVVKTLSTVLFMVMAAPEQLSHPAVVFLSGDDRSAKATTRALLHDLGWTPEQVLDLGGIATAATVEAAYPLAMAAVRAHGIAPFALTAVF